MFVELHTSEDNGPVLLNENDISIVFSTDGLATLVTLISNQKTGLYVRETYDEVKAKLLGSGSYTLDPDWEDGWGSK